MGSLISPICLVNVLFRLLVDVILARSAVTLKSLSCTLRSSCAASVVALSLNRTPEDAVFVVFNRSRCAVLGAPCIPINGNPLPDLCNEAIRLANEDFGSLALGEVSGAGVSGDEPLARLWKEEIRLANEDLCTLGLGEVSETAASGAGLTHFFGS